jgi:hypothetical protein
MLHTKGVYEPAIIVELLSYVLERRPQAARLSIRVPLCEKNA